ncbi:MAG TPA: hypothetical protein VLJ58_04520 [Ramlibacter sp.]|nr:hypothetical protein [Ramlibacter sp.]
MAKAKINFEVEEESLANAKAFVAKHGGSLNKLVSSLFASLGQDERARAPAIDPATGVLLQVSAGKLSLMEAAAQLKLPDAGYVLQRLASENLPLPRLTESELDRQAAESLEALGDCLIKTAPAAKRRKSIASAK